MFLRQAHTYVTLEISDDAYQEIRAKLESAGYGHAFMSGGEIDMHGIAVKSDDINAEAIRDAVRDFTRKSESGEPAEVNLGSVTLKTSGRNEATLSIGGPDA